jgi:anti-sigma factor RsiW
MSAVEQEHTQLGAYVLGALDPADTTEFERHLATCEQCRGELQEFGALREALDLVPPEAFLDGPPDAGDLLLQRTLRQIRVEAPVPAGPAARRKGPRRGLTLAAAAVIAVVVLGGGVVIGRQTAPVSSPVAQAPVPGTREVSGTNAATGASLTASVIPAAGWVKVHVAFKGIPAGEKCQLVITSKTGRQWVAGSWQVSGKAASPGFDGSAVIAPGDVGSVGIVTLDGRDLVSARV